MRLLADYHVHSNFSRFFHGKNTIEELVRTANAIGLKEIAITDHGFKHMCRTNKAKMRKAREIIDEINEWSTTKVLLGIEADIISEDGTIDVDNETLAMLDILIVGYHKLIKTDFANFFGKTGGTQADVQRCTNAFLNAIERYPITIISHLDSILKTDLYQIGHACKEKGVLVEINNRHTKWNKEQVDELIASDCLFVVSSDAHSREKIGEVDNAFDIIKKYEIPTENVANVEFTLEEKTETDIELDMFYGMYKKKLEERQLKEDAKEEKKRYEFTESLSPEMEKALQEIAQEQGLSYVKREEVQETEDDLFAETMAEIALIKQAQNYISENKLKEFENQNEKLVDLKEIERDEKVVQNAQNVSGETFAELPKNFVNTASLTADEPKENSVVIEESKPEEVNVVEPAIEVSQDVEVKEPVTTKVVPVSANVQESEKQPETPEILNFAVKTKKTVQESKPVATRSAAKTVSVNNSDAKPVQRKTSKARGGFMNNISNIVGDSKK